MAAQPLAVPVAHPEILHFIGIFIAISAAGIVRYIRRKFRSRDGRLPITPGGFIVLSGVAVLLVGLCCGLLGLKYVDVGIFIGLGAFLGLIHPVAGASFLAMNLILRPWEYDATNPFMLIMTRTLAALALLSWVLQALMQKRFSLRWSFACTLYVLFVAWLFFVSAVSDLGGTAGEIFSLFFPISVVALLVMNVIEDESDVAIFLNCVSLGVCGAVAAALAETLTGPMPELGPLRLKGSGQWGNANDLGALIALIFPIVLLRNFIHAKSLSEKLLGLLGVVILGAGLVMAQSRGAMLSLGGAAVAYGFVGGNILKKVFTVGVVLLMLLVVLVKGVQRNDEDLELSQASRLNYVVTGMLMLKDHPVLGVGFNNYPKLYESYTREWIEGGERTAHSSWVLVLSETGPIGFVLFVWLFGIALWRGVALRSQYPEFLLSLVSYGIAMSFLSHAYVILPYILMAIVLAAGRVHRSYNPKVNARAGKNAERAAVA